MHVSGNVQCTAMCIYACHQSCHVSALPRHAGQTMQHVQLHRSMRMQYSAQAHSVASFPDPVFVRGHGLRVCLLVFSILEQIVELSFNNFTSNEYKIYQHVHCMLCTYNIHMHKACIYTIYPHVHSTVCVYDISTST